MDAGLREDRPGPPHVRRRRAPGTGRSAARIGRKIGRDGIDHAAFDRGSGDRAEDSSCATARPESAGRTRRSAAGSTIASICWRGVLPNPMPGSRMTRERAMPAQAATARDVSKKRRMSSTMSMPSSLAARLCMTMTVAPVSPRPPRPSPDPPAGPRCRSRLWHLAPAPPGPRQPCGCRSTSGTLTWPARASNTGTMRRISSSAPTDVKPGRVDSPPMSRMAAPIGDQLVRVMRRPARPGSKRPPSEKLSGVTFRMPITSGTVGSRHARTKSGQGAPRPCVVHSAASSCQRQVACAPDT